MKLKNVIHSKEETQSIEKDMEITKVILADKNYYE